MILKFFDELIEMGEKIINTTYTINSSQDFLQLSQKVEFFMESTLRGYPETQYILRDIFIRNGYKIDVGWCDSKSCIPYTQKMVSLLKIAKECFERELYDNKKENIFQIGQILPQGNLIQNFGGNIQGDFNFENVKEKPETLWEKIKKWSSIIANLIKTFLKFKFPF